jgi:hypothetical protein
VHAYGGYAGYQLLQRSRSGGLQHSQSGVSLTDTSSTPNSVPLIQTLLINGDHDDHHLHNNHDQLTD